jgi:hypothetical protein
VVSRLDIHEQNQVKRKVLTGYQWLMPVVLATWEVVIGRIVVSLGT